MTGIARREKLELVPVVAMAPWDFSERRLPDDIGSRFKHPERWDVYRDACFADAGFGRLAPIDSGSPNIPVPELSTPLVLRKLLEQQGLDGGSLADDPGSFTGDASEDREFITGFSGGFALRDGGKVLLEPGCCCGLDSLGEWEETIQEQSEEWATIWNGHDPYGPDIRFDPAADLFFFRSGEWRETWPEARFGVPRPRMEQTVREARSALEAFARLLPDALPPTYGDDWKAMVAEQLAGLGEY